MRAVTEWTKESPAPGVVAYQPSRGYRYGVEVYALATFAMRSDLLKPGDPPATALDLGAGSGVLGLLLAYRGLRVTGVELDAAWVERARQGATESRLPVEVIHGDVRHWSGPRVDLVVTNPPWFDPARGPCSPDPMKAAARTCFHGDVADFVRVGLAHSDRVCVVTRQVAGSVSAGAWVARIARLGKNVVCFEVRAGTGTAVEEPLGDVYEGFR